MVKSEAGLGGEGVTQTQLPGDETQLSDGETQLSVGETQLSGRDTQLSDGETQLLAGENQLLDGETKEFKIACSNTYWFALSLSFLYYNEGKFLSYRCISSRTEWL